MSQQQQPLRQASTSSASSGGTNSTESVFINFATAGLGGMMGWTVVHPLNTLSVRMNLAIASNTHSRLTRQIFYSTSVFGFFEVIRDQIAQYREVDFITRTVAGICSGGIAAMVSCPAEVSLVRMSNDYSLPVEKRRNYRNVFDAFYRIVKEEGPSGFFRGVAPFVNRAMIVGAVQIGTYDHFREYYRKEKGVTNPVLNVFYSAMTSGLIYSFVTMPFEAAKNRMAFQKPDPATGKLQYDGMLSTWRFIVRNEGVLQLWAGYLPYYLRCGMHTLFMFMSIEFLRKLYKKVN